MQNRKVQFVIVAVLLTTVGVLLIPSMTRANPVGTPPWKYSGANPNGGIEQRDGYSRSFVVDANSVLFTVPEGREYVLVRLYARAFDNEPPNWWDIISSYDRDFSFWTLTIDGIMFLDERSVAHPYVYMNANTSFSIDGLLKEDFPEKTVVIRGGQTLGITKHEAIDKVSLTLIGYFCDAR